MPVNECIEAPAIGGLDGQEPAGCAQAKDGIAHWRGDAVRDGHGQAEEKGHYATGVCGIAGDKADEQEEAAYAFNKRCDHGEDFGYVVGKEMH